MVWHKLKTRMPPTSSMILTTCCPSTRTQPQCSKSSTSWIKISTTSQRRPRSWRDRPLCSRTSLPTGRTPTRSWTWSSRWCRPLLTQVPLPWNRVLREPFSEFSATLCRVPPLPADDSRPTAKILPLPPRLLAHLGVRARGRQMGCRTYISSTELSVCARTIRSQRNASVSYRSAIPAFVTKWASTASPRRSSPSSSSSAAMRRTPTLCATIRPAGSWATDVRSPMVPPLAELGGSRTLRTGTPRNELPRTGILPSVRQRRSTRSSTPRRAGLTPGSRIRRSATWMRARSQSTTGRTRTKDGIRTGISVSFFTRKGT
mmetsp:Transcript_18873/g.44002  ORF Transcript_18873/g.44002 Transcript_18873/m.44002 type:complete len:317 (+) Transcript_18873:795-1745(+)